MRKLIFLFTAISLFFSLESRAAVVPNLGSTVAATTFQMLLNKPSNLSTAVSLATLGRFAGSFNPINAAITVGGAVLMYQLSDGLNTAQYLGGKNAINSMPTPPTWIDPNTPPPIQETGTYQCNFSIGSSISIAATPQVACSDQGGTYAAGGSYGFGTCVKSSGSFTFPSSSIICGTESNSIVRCGPGYLSSTGNNCFLNPSVDADYPKWPADNKPSYIPNNGAWKAVPRDPDTIATNPSTRTGVDPYANPVSETVTPNPDNGVTIKRTEQSVDQTTGLPLTSQNTVQTDVDGTINGVYHTYYNSVLNSISSSNAVTNNTTTIDTTGLAQESTLSGIANILDQPITADVGNPTVTTPTLDTVPTISDSIDNLSNGIQALPLVQDVTALQNLSFPSTAVCPLVITIDLSVMAMGVISTDVICQALDSAAPILIVI